MNTIKNGNWPELPYKKFVSTSHLLHMCVQIIGKLKLNTPFEPEWANVILNVTARGLTSGLIPYKNFVFSIDIDFITHEIIFQNSLGYGDKFYLETMSVAELKNKIFNSLKKLNVDLTINPKPQEVPKPILFDDDKETQTYNKELANAWWRILLNSYVIMQQYHATYLGKTQPIGLMWGTFDLRDVRYKDARITTPTSGPNSGYLRRNAMDSDLIECGWWSGNEAYPKAAYYSFTFPEPEGINKASIKPSKARWDDNMKLFILDYDDLLQSNNPENELLGFLESTYQVGVQKSGWDSKLIGTGKPI
jgi:hypothetical protein